MPLTVYADGACPNNGRIDARGGWGVHFPGYQMDACGPLPNQPQTSNRAELYAVLEAIRRASTRFTLNGVQVNLHTDSRYCVDVFTEWVYTWQNNGWRKADRSEVENQDLIRNVLDAKRGIQVSFNWVRGHDHDPANIRADELARRGANGERMG